jgi:hypothetical protein
MKDLHFPIRIDAWARPLLLVGGATRENAYVELDDEELSIQFGWLFGATIPREKISGAQHARWPLWLGLGAGWRVGLGGLFGAVGSFQNVVEVRLTEPVRVWGLLRCRRLAFSLEQPDEFLAALAGGE